MYTFPERISGKDFLFNGTVRTVQRKKERNSKTRAGRTGSQRTVRSREATAETVDLVSVIANDDPFLITKEGAFVLMFEIPEIDMDIYGQTEAELCERYQMTLGALPPGTKLQLTVFEKPFDPSDDIRYFTERSEGFQQEIAFMDPTSLPYIQGKALASSCIAMIARTSEIYDAVKPIGKIKLSSALQTSIFVLRSSDWELMMQFFLRCTSGASSPGRSAIITALRPFRNG